MVNTDKNKRFQISITYWFHRSRWEIEYEELDGNENTFFTERVYWNWYPTIKEAVEEYERKLNLLKDDPCLYAEDSWDVQFVRIRLTDTAYSSVLEEKCFRL